MPSPESRKIIDMLRAQPRGGARISLPERRAAMESFARPPDADVRCQPVDADGVPAEWIEAPGVDRERAILYLHGGGYTAGSITTHRQLCGWLSRASAARVLALEYRLGPESRYPAALEDSVAGYRWLLSQAVPHDGIAVAGDSAGGGLAAATLVALRDLGVPPPACAVLISPWTDLAGTGPSLWTRAALDPMVAASTEAGGGLDNMARSYLGDADPKEPLASPLYADLAGLPPLLIQVGTEEALFDDAIRFDARARAAGVDVTLDVGNGMVHVWHVFAWLVPESRAAIARFGAFVREHTTARAAV